MMKMYALLYSIAYGTLNDLNFVQAKLESCNNYVSTNEKNNLTRLVVDVIYAHTDFDMIFHFDEEYRNLVDRIIMNMNNRTMKSVNLIYYDENVIGNNDLFTRPLVRKILNVIILKDMDNFGLFINSTENVNERDEALFVISNFNTDKTFLYAHWHIKLFGKVLVVCLDENQEVSVNAICYYCGRFSSKITRIAFANGSFLSAKTFDKKDFLNFDKHTFKVGFTEYYPFVSCKQIEEITVDNMTIHRCLRAAGTEYELLTMISQRLNFTYELILYPTYTQLINDLDIGKIDFVIGGITATSERAEKTTFTRQYWFEGYYFLYILSTNLKQELSRVLDPFDGHLWLLLATSTFVTSAVLYTLDRFESTKIRRITCSESLWVCLYMAVEQNANIKQVFKVRPGPAILLVSWILFSLNVSTAYKSKLSAIVMNPPYKEPNDLTELVENDYKFVVNDRYIDVFYALLFNTSDPVVQKAYGRTIRKEDLCEEFIYAVEERAAIIDEYTSLQYELRRSCDGALRAKRKDTTILGSTQIRITKKSLRTIGQVWLLQKRAAYRSGFDQVLGQIVEAGLVEMWFTIYTKDMLNGAFPESRHSHMDHYHSPLSLRLLLSLFLLYAIGNVCALFVFVVESILYHRKHADVTRISSLYKPSHNLEVIVKEQKLV